ncbi:MAG: twin-arginine translocase TatA/TatE family subunit [Mariprofundus sp.]|nr:twin-arginine translocase TatA/TatE family subunit [Mariprofundus sp.]
MPDIGIFELILIGVVLFVVVGPERMPEFLGQIGRWVRHGRSWMSHLGDEISRETSEISKPLQDVSGEIRSEIKAIKSGVIDVELANVKDVFIDKDNEKR